MVLFCSHLYSHCMFPSVAALDITFDYNLSHLRWCCTSAPQCPIEWPSWYFLHLAEMNYSNTIYTAILLSRGLQETSELWVLGLFSFVCSSVLHVNCIKAPLIAYDVSSVSAAWYPLSQCLKCTFDPSANGNIIKSTLLLDTEVFLCFLFWHSPRLLALLGDCTQSMTRANGPGTDPHS